MDCMTRNNRHTTSFAPSSPSSEHELHHRVSAGSLDPHYLPTPTVPSSNNSSSKSASLPPLIIPAPATSTTPPQDVPRIFGLPLKYVSLVTLAVQNAALTIIMHYSRVSTTPDKTYSAASAVLLNELLKGSISFAIAFSRTNPTPSDLAAISAATSISRKPTPGSLVFPGENSYHTNPWSPFAILSRARRLMREIVSTDCWKLSIPAILYVIQNNLQFVAAANLDVATFQVTYQMKILTTAAFSVALLRKRLSSFKWLALLLLAIGVGIVQIQAGKANTENHVEEALAGEPIHVHTMNPIHGFLAVTAACFTSGLAGVYFEMVLKNSQADLWVRNVQLSLFSLLPALVPVFFSQNSNIVSIGDIFKNFGFWAWATVLVQVFGGLITAVVIKYSDNIMKGFATSLSIVISFLASVELFDFSITPAFVIGASTVLGATWMYNQPEPKKEQIRSVAIASYPGSPVRSDAPILGVDVDKKRSSGVFTLNGLPLPSPRILADKLGFLSNNNSPDGSSPGAKAGALNGGLLSLSMTPLSHSSTGLSGSNGLTAPLLNASSASLSSVGPGRPPLSREMSATSSVYASARSGWNSRASSRASTPPPPSQGGPQGSGTLSTSNSLSAFPLYMSSRQ